MAKFKTNWTPDSVLRTKKAVITVNKRNFGGLVKKLGGTPKAGAKSYTFKGNRTSLTDLFAPVNKKLPIGKGRTETRYRGLLVGKDINSVTLKAGTLGRTVAPQNISKLSASDRAERSARISTGDARQFINFGLRADGSARLGYTLEQCAFSQAYIRAGGRGDYDRYGTGSPKGYNYSVIHQVRVKMGIDARVQQRSKR